MKHIRKVELDIDREHFEKIPAVQYDNNSRYLQVTLMSGVGPLDITGHTVMVTGTKPDGKEIFNSCKVLDPKAGLVEVHISEQVAAAEGMVDCNIQLYGSDKSLLSTQQFHIAVGKAVSNQTVESSNEFKGLVDAISVVTQIDNKMDRGEAIAVSQINKNTGKFDQTYMSDELLQQIAGTTPVNAIPPDGGVTTEKLADNSVNVDKFLYLQVGKNLFDPDATTKGFFVSEYTGRLTESSMYDTSDFIKVYGGKPVAITENRKWALYDTNYNFLSGYDNASTSRSIVTPEVDGYLKASFHNGTGTSTNRVKTAQIEYSDTHTPYAPYRIEFTGGVKASEELFEGATVPSTSLPLNGVKAEHCSFIAIGNLFNKLDEDNIPDHFMNAPGNSTSLIPSPTYGVSHFIPVTKGTYVGQCVRNIAEYSESKTFLKITDNPTVDTTVFEIESPGYVKISYYQTRDVVFSAGSELPETTKPYELTSDVFVKVGNANIEEPLLGSNIQLNTITADHCDFVSTGKNLFNKDTCIEGYYINPSGSLTELSGYMTSDYIRVNANTDYVISKCRKLCVYDNLKVVQSSYGLDVSPDSELIVNLPFDGYIRISARTTYYETVQVEQSSEATEFEPYGIHIPLLLNSGATSPTTNSGIHVIDLSNVDRIGAIGDSYTESHYTLKGKAYLCKLSLFSDYNWENFAQSGDTYRGNLNRIRRGQPIYHSKLSWKDYRPTHALCISYTNDLKYMDAEQYGNDLRAVIETVKGLGAIPILATEYHCNFGRGIQNTILGIANEYGLDVINILPKSMAMRGDGKDYAPFWGGSHPGTRSNHVLCDPLDEYFKRMERPFQSIKIFRKREEGKATTLDSLLFNSNVERAKKFKEIMIGHSALNNPEEYDECTTSANSKVVSEYLMLQNGENVSFDNYALIDVVVPSTSRDCEYIDLNISEATATVYVKNVMASPYPSPVFYQRFDHNGSYNVVKGDTYVSNDPKFAGTTFTVQDIQEGTILMSPCKQLSSETGVLTKVSGSGASTLDYFYTAVGFSSDYPTGKLDCGHWVAVSRADGNFRVPKDLLKSSMDYDKISFLVVKDGQFTLNNIQVLVAGTVTKSRKSLKRTSVSTLPSYATQLLPEQFVGTTEQLKNWQVIGQASPYVPIDNVLPKQCVGCVDVTKSTKLTQSVSVESVVGEDRKAIVRVWARYFPKVFNKSTMSYPKDSAITEDTFDYASLNVSTTIYGKEYKLTDLVGLGWKEVEFEMFVPSEITSLDLSVWAEDKSVQIAKCSMFLT